MKKFYSGLALAVICLVMVLYRIGNTERFTHQRLNVTEWDAFGYHMYNPALFIYHDYKQLNWLDTIDRKYHVTGGDGWQAMKADNGNYVFKYLGGVAVMQMPFFLTTHAIVRAGGKWPADGFSAPYQYAVCLAALVYAFIGLLVLRKILLRYFSDQVTAVTLLLLALASNFLQYAAVDSGLSHIYIFCLYALVMYTTLRWHEEPRLKWAFLTGLIIGFATMSRPTEAVMLFIPLMWGIWDRESSRRKWAMVKERPLHVAVILLSGLIGILPQLLYWKSASGHFIFDVGSKWVFLNPYFRVLFGWEKGWFIYTPVTVLFIAGMFFIKKFPFRQSVLWFCLLNIWIIIAWDDWRYGGTYSTRALVQSYPMFALPLAALTERALQQRWRALFYVLGVYLTGVNLFQTWQFDRTILHFNDMNRLYYSHIYLNPSPTPLDMSLLDTDEFLDDPQKYDVLDVLELRNKPVDGDGKQGLAEQPVALGTQENWFLVTATIRTPDRWGIRLGASLQSGDSVKATQVRLFNEVGNRTGKYAFYIKAPSTFRDAVLRVYLDSPPVFHGVVEELKVTRFVSR